MGFLFALQVDVRCFLFINIRLMIQIIIYLPKLSLQYTKMIAASCNTSGITFIKPLCRLRVFARNDVRFSLGFETIKPLTEIFVI